MAIGGCLDLVMIGVVCCVGGAVEAPPSEGPRTSTAAPEAGNGSLRDFLATSIADQVCRNIGLHPCVVFKPRNPHGTHIPPNDSSLAAMS